MLDVCFLKPTCIAPARRSSWRKGLERPVVSTIRPGGPGPAAPPWQVVSQLSRASLHTTQYTTFLAQL